MKKRTWRTAVQAVPRSRVKVIGSLNNTLNNTRSISESSLHKSTIYMYEPTREQNKKVMFGVVSLTAGIGVLVEGESLG